MKQRSRCGIPKNQFTKSQFLLKSELCRDTKPVPASQNPVTFTISLIKIQTNLYPELTANKQNLVFRGEMIIYSTQRKRASEAGVKLKESPVIKNK